MDLTLFRVTIRVGVRKTFGTTRFRPKVGINAGPMDDADRQLANIGKGMVQISLRLNRLLELAESGTKGRTEDNFSLDLLLDLLEAIEQTLLLADRPVSLSRLQRLFRVPAPTQDLKGLSMARNQARQRLQEASILPVPVQGPVDTRLQRVVETLPTSDPALDGQVARTHTAGWYRVGDPPTSLRLAMVSVWKCTSFEAS